ncbi:MAG: tetratricopeptide repeat protein [Polyangiaceae bacterium]
MSQRLFSTTGTSLTGGHRAVLSGRAAEMRELEDAYGEVADHGGVIAVTVVGAAGIGKTRLVSDFLGRLRTGDGPAPKVLRGTAREHGAPYEIFARALRARFNLVEGMDAEHSKAQIRSEVATVLDDRKVGDVLYYLGQILDLEYTDSPLTRAVGAEPREQRWLRNAIVKHFLESDAVARHADDAGVAGRITILVFDDLHTAHTESLDLLQYLVAHVRAPILVISLSRPEILTRREELVSGRPMNHRLIELAPLSDADSAAVMHDLLAPCGEEPLVGDLVDSAVSLAAGNPALLEQMVHLYLEKGVLEGRGSMVDDPTWSIHVERLAKIALPLTVEDAVQARIAALGSAERELLERAATMGGVFWLGGLLAVVRQDGPAPTTWRAGDVSDIATTRGILADLVERDYLLRMPDSSFPGDEEYVFKHNLEREALQKLTPAPIARKHHLAIAEWMSFREQASTNDDHLAMLARHWEKASKKARAGLAYLAAADAARTRYANSAAAEYYAKGLALVAEGEGAPAETWIGSLHHYGDVLQLLGRNDEALLVFREMQIRAFRLDLRGKGGAAHSRIGRLLRETGRLEEAGEHLDAALALYEEANDVRGLASAQDDIGKLHWLRGDYARAFEYTERALAMRRKIGDRKSIALSLNNLGLVYQDSGQFRPALEAFEQALTIRHEIGDLVGVSITLNNLGTVAQDQRDDLRALQLFQQAYDVAKETGDRNRIAVILTNLGETHNRLGDPPMAVKVLKQAEELADELGDKLGLAEAVRGLGKAYLAQREWTKARECAARAVELFSEIESKVQLGVALRSLGEVTAAGAAGGQDAEDAKRVLKESIAIFESVGNEVELARSCRAYADMLTATSEFSGDPEAAKEAAFYRARAEETFAKLRISAVGLEPRSFFWQR